MKLAHSSFDLTNYEKKLSPVADIKSWQATWFSYFFKELDQAFFLAFFNLTETLQKRRGFEYGFFHWLWSIFLTSFFSLLYFIFYIDLLVYFTNTVIFQSWHSIIIATIYKGICSCQKSWKFFFVFCTYGTNQLPILNFQPFPLILPLVKCFFFWSCPIHLLAMFMKKIKFSISCWFQFLSWELQ